MNINFSVELSWVIISVNFSNRSNPHQFSEVCFWRCLSSRQQIFQSRSASWWQNGCFTSPGNKQCFREFSSCITSHKRFCESDEISFISLIGCLVTQSVRLLVQLFGVFTGSVLNKHFQVMYSHSQVSFKLIKLFQLIIY